VVLFRFQKRRKEFNVSFAEPYFLERELLAGVDFFHSRTNYHKESAYDMMASGGGVRFGYDLADHIGQMWSYGLRRTKLYHVDAYASRFILASRRRATISEFGHHLTFDYRDNRLNPNRGLYVNLSQDVAGLGGNTRYVRFSNSGAYYKPLTDDVIFSLSGEFSYIHGLNQKIDINNRFFLGG
jgi:outer membrane protein insertion porin family